MNSNDFLQHYGVKGMKWGVRRYQNVDGTLTEAGKQRAGDIRRVKNAAKTKPDVDRVYRSLSTEQRKLLGADPKINEYLSIQEGEYLVKRFLAKDGDRTVGFFDLLAQTPHETNKNIELSMAVDSSYQGKGYGAKLAKQGSDWIRKHQNELGNVDWSAYQWNEASKKLAEKNGWKYDPRSDKEWAVYHP